MLRRRISLTILTVTVVAAALLSVLPAQALPEGLKKPKIVTLQIYPGYFNDPLPPGIVDVAVKDAVVYFNSVAGPRVKFVADIRPARKLRAPGGSACNSYPKGQFPFFPKLNGQKVIPVSIVQGEEWCPTRPVGGGVAQMFPIDTQWPRTITVWPTLEAKFPGSSPVRIEQGVVINSLASVLVHEVGHTAGLKHATSLTCQDESGNNVPLSGKCSKDEYGDVFDIMGRGLQFSALTSETLKTDRFPKLPIRSGQGNMSLTAKSAAPIRDRVARFSSSHGDIYFEYVPDVGVVARNYSGKFDKKFYRMGDTGLLSYGTYTDGSPRQAMVAGDSWSIPGGETVSVISTGPEGAVLGFESTGTTALRNDVDRPRIQMDIQDDSFTYQLQGSSIEDLQFMVDPPDISLDGPGRRIVIIEKDGERLVNKSWRPSPNEWGVVLRDGRVFSVWRDLGNPFTTPVPTS